MNNLLTVTIIKRVCDGFYDLYYLILILTFMVIFRLAQLSALHVFHYNVKEICVVIYLVNLYYVGVLQFKQYLAFIQEGS